MTATSFANAAAKRDQRWVVIVRIEGVGTYSGQYAFCSNVPDYASGNSLYRDDLVAYPDPLSERSPPIGGLPEAGSSAFEILDRDNVVIAALRTERPPQTRLTSAMTSTQTTIVLDSGTGITASASVVYVGNEAILIGTLVGGTTYNCTRGALDTDAQSHLASAPVYLSLPYLPTRRARLYYAPADGTSSSTEQEFGSYRISKIAMGSQLNAWNLGGSTQLKYLNRRINSAIPGVISIDAIENNGRLLLGHPIVVGPRGVTTLFSDIVTWSGLAYVLIADEEVASADFSIVGSGAPYLVERGLVGTAVLEEIQPGDTWQFALAAISGGGSYRVSPGSNPSEDRAAGTWNGSDHWIDILLCHLTSSAHEDDGLELVNHRGTGGLYSDGSLSDEARSNWSSLPIGFGIGVPANLLDLESFVAVKRRTHGHHFAAFWTGKEPEPFDEWVNKNFLEPLGAFLVSNNGRISIILPRLPLAGETTTSVTVDDMLDGDIEVERATDLHSGSITYKFRREHGGEATNTFNASDFASLFGQRGLYTFDDNPITIEVPGIASDQAGLSAFLQEIAIRRLFRFSRSVWRLKFSTDFSFYASNVGDLWDITHPELPDETNGTRGWTSVIVQIIEKEVHLDDARGAVIDWTVIGYGPGFRAARVSPSAVVTNVAGDVATVAANRYTSPDNDLLGLPDIDAGGFDDFSAQPVVSLYNRDGTAAAGGTETVVSVSGNDIELSGDFGGALANGLVLVFADYSSATSEQTTRFAYHGDASFDIADTGTAAWRYAEG